MHKFTTISILASNAGTDLFVKNAISRIPEAVLRDALTPIILKEQSRLFEIRANGRNDSHYDDLHELNEGVQILLNRPERYVHRRGEGAYAFAQARKDDWIGTDHSLGSRALTIMPRLATYAVQLNLAQKEMKGGRITNPEYQAIHTFIEGCMESTIHAMDKNSSFATGPLSDYYEELRGSHSCYEPFDYYRNVICPEAKSNAPFGTDTYGQARLGPLFSSDR